MTRHRPTIDRITCRLSLPLAGVLLAAALLATVGCEGPGAIARVVTGPDRVPAAYELPHRPTVIVCDDRDGVTDRVTILSMVEAYTRQQLLTEAGFEEMLLINPQDVADLRSQLGERWDQAGLGAIGRRLDAEQVVYVSIEQWGLSDEGTLFRPTALMRIKVIDATTGQRAFPARAGTFDNVGEAAGVPVRVELPYLDPRVDGTDDTQRMHRAMAAQAGVQVARLFHSWRRPDSGELLREGAAGR